MDTKLHHFAYNIRPNTLELVLSVFEILGCELRYRKGEERWCMVGQRTVSTSIQIIEIDDESIDIKKKFNTHIGFLSDDQKDDIEKIKKWAEGQNLKFIQGGWSDKELWFDLPDLFINFVIEIMHTSVVE